MKVITVFGSSAPQPGQPDYEAACELGRLLAQAGFAVASGGYIGVMEAVSRGAAEVGGQVIGVTCDEIERWRTVGPNRWLSQEVRYPTLVERLIHLVTRNDGMVAMGGGVGTLTEVALAWNQLQVQVIRPRPLVLLGDIWHRTMATFADSPYVPEAHRALFQLAATPQEAVALLMGS
jgi:uncharacterized protein (TIGR00730 family)